MLDFTALGDAVNVGARLQAHASAGEVYPGGRPERIAIRGRDKPVDIVVLTPAR